MVLGLSIWFYADPPSFANVISILPGKFTEFRTGFQFLKLVKEVVWVARVVKKVNDNGKITYTAYKYLNRSLKEELSIFTIS